MKSKISIIILILIMIIGIGSSTFAAGNCPDPMHVSRIPPYVLSEAIKVICINEGGMIRTGNTPPSSKGGPEAYDTCPFNFRGVMGVPDTDNDLMHYRGTQELEGYESVVSMNTPTWHCAGELDLPPYAAYIFTSTIDSGIPVNIYNSETMKELWADIYRSDGDSYQSEILDRINQDIIDEIDEIQDSYSDEELEQIKAAKISLNTMERAIKYGYLNIPGPLSPDAAGAGGLIQQSNIEETQLMLDTHYRELKRDEELRDREKDKVIDHIMDLDKELYEMNDYLPYMQELWDIAGYCAKLVEASKGENSLEKYKNKYETELANSYANLSSAQARLAEYERQRRELIEANAGIEYGDEGWNEYSSQLTHLNNCVSSCESYIRTYSSSINYYNGKISSIESKLDSISNSFEENDSWMENNLDRIINIIREYHKDKKMRPTARDVLESLDNIAKYRNDVARDKKNIREVTANLNEYKIESAESEKKILNASYALYVEAMKFEEFYKKTQEDGGYKTEDISGKINILVDAKTNEYIVGPFSISYRKAEVKSSVTGERITFGAITGMCIEKNDGSIIPEEEIELIRSPHDVVIDEQYKYPNPYEEFFVKFKVKSAQEAAGIRIKVDFGWLDECTGWYHRLEGTGDIMGYAHTQTIHDPHDHGEAGSCSSRYIIECVKVGEYTAQILAAVETGSLERVYKSKSLYLGSASKKPNPPGGDPGGDPGDPGNPGGDPEDPDNPGGDPEDPDNPGGNSGNPDNPDYIPLTMELGGIVFKEAKLNKEGTADGIYLDGYLCGNCGQTIASVNKQNGAGCPYCGAPEEVLSTLQETLVEGITVTLYEKGSNTPYKLIQENEENPLVPESEKEIRTNPTITNAVGKYSFKGLDPMKQYYVKFTYNGQPYQPTYYMNRINESGKLESFNSSQEMVGAQLYNTNDWKINSKAKEWQDEREKYNESFREIGSNPSSYISSNSLGYLQIADGNKGAAYYNIAYSKNIITHTTFSYDEQGNWQEFHDTSQDLYIRINDKVKKYIKENKEYPNLPDIYNEIIQEEESKGENGDKEIRNKLQFIEDCKIDSYTSSKSPNELEYYPVYDKFIIDSTVGNEPYKITSKVRIVHNQKKRRKLCRYSI